MAANDTLRSVMSTTALRGSSGRNMDHDVQSDDHSMIIGSLALLLALLTIILAIVQYRPNSRTDRVDGATRPGQGSNVAIYLMDLGVSSDDTLFSRSLR